MAQSDFITFSPNGYFLAPAGGGDLSTHTMCGSQAIPGAISPNSGAPLLLVASLDLRDPALGIASAPVQQLHLLYSWTCPISEGPFAYRITSFGIELVEFTEGPAFTDFPYDGYPAFFPRYAVTLRPLTVEDQGVIKKLNRHEGDVISLAHSFPLLAVPRSQVGGEPRLMQYPIAGYKCPVCKKTTRLLATIGNDNGSEQGFAGNNFVQMLFYFCDSCSVVIADNITD